MSHATGIRLFAITSAGVLLVAMSGCGSSSESKSTSTDEATTARTAQTPSSTTATGGSSSSSRSTGAGIVTGSEGGVSATLHAGTHHPKVDRPWPIHFIVTSAGRPAKASVSYEYLLAGQIVARRSHYTFEGHFSDVFMWPSSAVGYPLTFRAVIVANGVTIDLDYPVQVVA